MKFGIRNGDLITCGAHGTPAPLVLPIIAISTVFFDKLPAFGMSNLPCGCSFLTSSKTVLIEGKPAIRMSDSLISGKVLQGSSTVLIGD